MKKNPLLFRNLAAMKILGLWPPNNKKLLFFYNIYSKFVFTWFICFTTSQYVEMKYIYNDFKELTSNAGVSLLYSVGIAKVYIILFQKQRFVSLVTTIRTTELEILDSKDEKLNQILKEYFLQNWSVSKKFWLLTFWTIMGFFVSPSIEKLLLPPQEILYANGTATGRFKKPLIFSSWFPFDKYRDTKNYMLAYGLQTISGTIGASYLAIWDTFIVALMIFAIGQFRILQYYFRNIYPYDYDYNNASDCSINSQSDIIVKETTYNFVKCVKHHNMIIQ